MTKGTSFRRDIVLQVALSGFDRVSVVQVLLFRGDSCDIRNPVEDREKKVSEVPPCRPLSKACEKNQKTEKKVLFRAQLSRERFVLAQANCLAVANIIY